MSRYHTDLSIGAITTAPVPATSGTTLIVTDAIAANLPDLYPWWGLVKPTGENPTRSNSEIIKVTAGISAAGFTTYTLVRAQGIPVTTARSITAGDDIYEAVSAEGTIGANSFITETPSGTINSSNTAFTVANTYSTMFLTRDGQLLEPGGADYTLSGTSITMVSAPVTGSVLRAFGVTASTVSGNADTIDGYHANSTPTPNTIPVLDSDLEIWSGGWRVLPALTYEGADAPTYTFSIAADMTGKIGVGFRIKLTQATGGVKYFIVNSVGTFTGGKTIILVHGGTDYALNNEAITSPFFSREKAPLGFPLSPAKWTINFNKASNSLQASPTQNTWYNQITCAIAIGSWNCFMYAQPSNNSRGSAGIVDQLVTLSTANNSESNARTTIHMGEGNSVTFANSACSKQFQLDLTSKTNYYTNHRTTQSGLAGIGFANYILELVNAYL